LETGAKTSTIKASVARSIDVPIVKTSQRTQQADGVTPFVVDGETCRTLLLADERPNLDALVVEDLGVDLLVSTLCRVTNGLSIHPAKGQVPV